MKAASSCAGARKLLASVAAALAATLTFSMPTAHADDHPANPADSHPKVGTSDESVPGFRLTVEKKEKDGKIWTGHVTPHLFTVHTSANKEDAFKAYCIELDVDIRYDSSLRIGGWKDFPGKNKFKDNPDVQAKVAWIAQNSYPQTDLAKVAETSGVSGLTEKEAITATQAAIWHFTNPDEYRWLGLQEGDQATQSRVEALFKYLTGEKNAGLKEPTHPAITIKGGELPFALNEAKTEGRVGPIRFESNQATVKLTSELKYELVDKDGKAVDKNAVPTNTDLYLKVPANTTSGEQEFKATTTGTVQAGKLFITKNAVIGGDHGQTIITVSTKEIAVNAQGKITWSTPKPSAPTAQPTQPTAQPTQPTAQPTQPTAQPTQPTAQPTHPTAQPTQPTAQPTQPTAKPTQPTATTPKPTPKKPGLPRTGD